MKSDEYSDSKEDEPFEPVEFFLFAKNYPTFRAQLEELQKLSENENLIEELSRFVVDDVYLVEPDDGTNNTWRAEFDRSIEVDRNLPDPPPDLGYGWPLLFPTEAVARDILAPFFRFGDTFRAMLMSEITAAPFDLAPRGNHWCAGTGRGTRFGTWRHGRDLIGADALRTVGKDGAPLTGANVNVFIVDQGVSKSYVESLGGTYGGGLSNFTPMGDLIKAHGQGKDPYTPLPLNHGAMMVRTILDLAPNARIFDLPLLPDRVTNITNFVQSAVFAYFLLKVFFLDFKLIGPWVVVNPWGVVNRFGETIRFDYTGNSEHALNQKIREIASEHDVIFSAGNSGQFCPNPRAPRYDVGPRQSIFGANGLKEVTSVAAVRSDGAWVGASSQGPAQFELNGGCEVEKPDFAAPSWYVDTKDAALRSTGTSAAAAVTAGVVAALRSGWTKSDGVSPDAMRQALRIAARDVTGPGWSERTGAGILQVPGTIDVLNGIASAKQAS